MGNKKFDLLYSCLLKTLPFIVFTAIILIPIGITFLCISHKVNIKEQIVDYTDCKAFEFDSDGSLTCAEKNVPCVCFHNINITDSLEGDVTVYYELESFDQLRSDYVNSRDDNQLMGVAVPIPSENCEPYRFVHTTKEKISISPCGAIADAMFNDTYELRNTYSNIITPFRKFGILTEDDKVGYHNPENWEDFKNFSKPINWDKNIWELDTSNSENNGFQNERFIGWMKTEWKRKPYARIDKAQTQFENGLQAGEYELRVGYNYPSSRYSGRRKFIISANSTTTYTSLNAIGIISLVIGLILLVIASVAFIIHKRIKGNEADNNGDVDAVNENLTSNHQPHIPEDNLYRP
ncbi:cell cycle control protein 50A-like [Vanessa atalanta]|uniref:cell cycle control protein 50A-like n=1 Tax=Vanessa atalanta TaxID=42275 RepID=UPI001FCCE04D|nr:cell cycle control protein 50A-like [Vanessa atalanta]